MCLSPLTIFDVSQYEGLSQFKYKSVTCGNVKGMVIIYDRGSAK